MIRVEFVGAAQTVTGSKHLVRTDRATILLDCGLFQGRRRESIEINRTLGVNPRELDAVVLSHAHIDHSGALPLLVKEGYSGPIYATSASRDLCSVMLADAALIQKSDARTVNKAIERDHVDMEPVEPLYDETDVVGVLQQMVSIPYRRTQQIAPGIRLTFIDAGHVLGSAMVLLDIEDEGETKRIVYTGDIGRRGMPILRDPEIPEHARMLIMESTYGDRLHKPLAQMDGALAEVVTQTVSRHGKIVIPSFALERAQEVIYAIARLRRAGRIPKLPIFVDSPLTVKITDIFKLHPECYDEEAREMLNGAESPFEQEDLRYVASVEESKALAASTDPAMIISASGMCEAGRILHHLRTTIENDKNTIAIVGYQAQHTLGRRIAERREKVRIFGVEHPLRAHVAILDGFSAHADQHDLIELARKVDAGGGLRQIALVHGEPTAQHALQSLLAQGVGASIAVPAKGDALTVL